MFFKFKRLIIFILLAFIIPLNVLAYSDKVIVSGENIGITLYSNGILIVGTYEVNGDFPAAKAGLKNGDTITKINDESVNNIDEMASKINNISSNEIKITYKRGNDEKKTNLKLYKDESNVYKTGLFVKDSITGIGTLTFIDPNTKKFGALGHEILEQSTGKIFNIKDGKIFSSNVTSIIPSNDGNPGEKKAEYDSEDVKGTAKKNTEQGIFGDYTDSVNEKKLYKVAKANEISIGKAKVLTVLNNKEVNAYDINITEIVSDTFKNKNFIFEITDKELIEKTGGIVQGMSGSPIIRGDKILGAVTHVVVNDTHKGYGIFITNMLEEAEK